ncbi:MAG: translocation/assembly module TamB domain-containing protein, partial [Burkholderiales bacterium]|nr:translocation/assembly module TamB domain-containing protein [Opitutaceae bacterium]
GGARRRPGEEPMLDLALKAERFPLLRKPGLLLRGDLDLAVKTDEATRRTRVGGEVRMRDSLFLADIRPLIAATSGGGGSAAAARARPPYFSVDTEPLGGWALGVTVRGDEFLRLRTPVFEGVGSTRFSLTGTLRDPRVEGEFVIDEGRILFPFASFTVQDGAVRILRNDPFTPRLDFRAQGRRLGYDLRLELTGTAEAPQLQLFSTPALDAEALLLMVTAGVSPEQDQTSRASQRLAAVGAYVSRDLLRTLGLASTDEERLSIQAGEQVSRAGRETYGFDFRLDERWSLVGDYDEFDAYNMGVKWRIRARPPAEEPEKREEKNEP